MKPTSMKSKLMTLMLALCMVLSLMPVSAFADETAGNSTTETADFTVGDGAAALALLNAAKSGAEDSAWDSETKTLTLKGVDFTTTAMTAMKMPDGAVIVLADGTENRITGGDAEVNENGEYNNDIYVYGIYAEGALTIKGETAGTGTLSVNAGKHTNSGDAWTYSAALYAAKGAIKVEGGAVTLTGGETSSYDCAFSYGAELTEGSSLAVTGGSLTVIGGKSIDKENGEDASFSRGIDAYKASISVSGSGKLTAKCDDEMAGEGLAYGIYISEEDFTISDNAEVSVTATYAITISNGDLKVNGGTVTTASTKDGAYGIGRSISVERNGFGADTGIKGNIIITGGSLEDKKGGISMDRYGAADDQSCFSVSAGTVKTSSVYGAHKFSVSGSAKVETEQITTDELTVNGGNLTVREPVRYNEYSGSLYANSALSVDNLTVNSGILDVAWDWGKYTPIEFPIDEKYGGTPLVKMYENDTATFNGGTSTFDSGHAGNIVIEGGTVTTGSKVAESGGRWKDASTLLQKYDDTPVVFKIVSSGGGGGGSVTRPSAENPTITVGDGGKAELSKDGTTLTITSEEGKTIDKVLLNGKDMGAVTELKGLKTGDKVEVSFKDKTAEPTKAQLDKKAKDAAAALKLKARSVKLKNGNIKVTVFCDAEAIEAIKSMGYTVKFKYYRSTSKAKNYKAMLESKNKTYRNSKGVKGTKYYYKARVMIYDESGKLIAKTALKQCRYASRTWGK